MAGPMFQPLTPCGSHELCWPGLSWMTILLPGGASGVLSRLRDISACVTNLHQRCMGKFGSVIQSPATKCSLNVHMACSAALIQCMCGG
eukprot:14637323-Ditylum_brightwellii.AAC.1